MKILRISLLGIFTDAYSPSLATSCTDDPALRATWAPLPCNALPLKNIPLGTLLHVVEQRAERDVLERQGVARQRRPGRPQRWVVGAAGRQRRRVRVGEDAEQRDSQDLHRVLRDDRAGRQHRTR